MINALFDEKASEEQLRRKADRLGLKLRKSRTRNPESYLYGTFMLVDPDGNYVVAKARRTATVCRSMKLRKS